MIEVKAFAKINLYLRVLGRRTDGYHDLETLFQEIDLHDKISWEPANGPAILADDPSNNENLVIRAANAFAEVVGRNVGGVFRLEKRIPIGGGLGGGSSNAAATLRMLNKFHGNPLDDAALHKMALALGSDVPFFIQGGTQVGMGRGEQLRPVHVRDIPQGGFLFFPPMGLATPRVFVCLTEMGYPPERTEPARVGENDLLGPARQASMEFAAIWRVMHEAFEGERFFMSGSGTTMVCLTEDREPSAERRALLDQQCISWQPFSFLHGRDD